MKRFALVVSAWLPIAVAGMVIAAGGVWGAMSGPSQLRMAMAATPEDGVAVQLFKFRPDRVDIKAGTRLTWTNQDEITHTVTAGTPDKPDPAFDFRLAGKGTTAAFEFARSGTFTYFCARHPAMRGEIHVN